jgi:hypothetical protein
MKQTFKPVLDKAIVWAVGITLAVIPLSAFAAYIKSPGTSIVKELDGTDTRTGEYKIVGTITIPQTKMDNLLDDTKKVLATFKSKEKPLTAEEKEIRRIKSEILAKEMMIARLQGETK